MRTLLFINPVYRVLLIGKILKRCLIHEGADGVIKVDSTLDELILDIELIVSHCYRHIGIVRLDNLSSQSFFT